MSPEEELYELACQDMPVTGDEVRVALDKFKRAYADELSGEIRDLSPCRSLEWTDAVNWAADLIDPTVPGG